LGWEIIGDKFVEEMKIKLESLEKWDNPDQRYILFWNDLKEDIEILCAQAQPESFGSLQNEEKTAIIRLNKNLEKLIKDIDNQFKENKDDHLNEKIVIAGHAFARLKLLQETKINDDKKLQGKLIEMLKEDPWPSVEDFWVKADEMTWGKIERACEDNEIEFTSPHINEIQPICKFQLIQFNIFPKNKALGNNYLFKKGLEYLWTLDIERKKLFGKVEVKRLTDPRTNEPRLVQYVPVRGKLKVTVELRRNGIPAKEKIRRAHPLIIKGSEDFGFLGAFSTAEVTALAIAALFAIVSGLAAFYISNLTFGSIDDYFKLFIWGAGVDLGKNFIQQLQLTSKGSKTT